MTEHGPVMVSSGSNSNQRVNLYKKIEPAPIVSMFRLPPLLPSHTLRRFSLKRSFTAEELHVEKGFSPDHGLQH